MTATIVASSALVSSSCSTNPDEKKPEKKSLLTSWLEKLSPTQTTEIQLYVRSANGQLGTFGYLDAEICSEAEAERKKMKQIWKLPIVSPTGRYNAFVTISGEAASATPKIELDQNIYELKTQPAKLTTAITSICKRWNKDPKTKIWVQDEVLKKTALAWLNLITPDCKIKNVMNRGWDCELLQTNPHTAAAALAEIQKKMIRKWSRHPYLFTRKLAVSRKLAAVLTKKGDEKGFRIFCNIAENSLRSELPVALGNPRWQKSVCSSGASLEKAKKLANTGLRDAVKELKVLYDLVEKTSRLGIVQIKIPRDIAPSKNLWVSLKPIFSSFSSTDEKSTDSKVKSLAPGCWHPIYSESPSLFILVDRLSLLEKTQVQGCLAVNSKKDLTPYGAPNKWIADSITGETEFIVTNGNSKILRLPKGTYSYQIHSLPKNATQWQPSEADPKTSGTINWTARRPSNVIRTW